MSNVNVKSVIFDGKLELEKCGGNVYAHKSFNRIYGYCQYNGALYEWEFSTFAGYRGNFASSPDTPCVQAIVPSYVPDDPVYNKGFDLHDWLYSVCGEFYNETLDKYERFSRNDVDAFAKGIMYLSPTVKNTWKNVPFEWLRSFGRWLRCDIMDTSVGLFAGGKKHWGNDSYSSRCYAKMTMREVKR